MTGAVLNHSLRCAQAHRYRFRPSAGQNSAEMNAKKRQEFRIYA
jgi:hypothetical protein